MKLTVVTDSIWPPTVEITGIKSVYDEISKATRKSIHFNEPQELNILSQKILNYSFNRVLDVGCGGGTLLALITQKSHFQPKLLCGIDLSLQRLKQAEFLYLTVKLFVGML